jgi:hypothetical protein
VTDFSKFDALLGNQPATWPLSSEPVAFNLEGHLVADAFTSEP